MISLAPESVQSNANVIALAMWRTAFGGVNDFGTGSAIAVLPLPARRAGAGPQRPPFQAGGLMAAAADQRSRCRRRRRRPRRKIVYARSRKAPLRRAARRRSALLWLVPTFGLFITSILPAVDPRLPGLVADLRASRASRPGRTTDALFHNQGLTQRAQDDRLHRRRQHGARRLARRDGRLRARLARVPGPRLGLHR